MVDGDETYWRTKIEENKFVKWIRKETNIEGRFFTIFVKIFFSHNIGYKYFSPFHIKFMFFPSCKFIIFNNNWVIDAKAKNINFWKFLVYK